jgi:hypothetical protein
VPAARSGARRGSPCRWARACRADLRHAEQRGIGGEDPSASAATSDRASACACTAATSGLGNRRTPERAHEQPPALRGGHRRIEPAIFRSAPAQKHFVPAAASKTARTPSSRAARSSCSTSASRSASSIALARSGRSSVRTRTPPSCRTPSPLIASPRAHRPRGRLRLAAAP